MLCKISARLCALEVISLIPAFWRRRPLNTVGSLKEQIISNKKNCRKKKYKYRSRKTFVKNRRNVIFSAYISVKTLLSRTPFDKFTFDVIGASK